MLKFRNTTAFAIAALLVVITANMFVHIPFYVYVAIALVYSLILFYGCYFIGSNYFIKVICSANTDKKAIAITFDDGPAIYTLQILSILQHQCAEAAFFCIGSRITGNEQILKQIHQRGHIIGNHSFSHHFLFDLFPWKKMLGDLQQMDDAVLQVTGWKPKFFRPPYGVTNPAVKKSIMNGHYIPVGWNVRSMDTVTKNEEKLLKKIENGIAPGAIFLFHDTSATTLAILPKFIEVVKQRGYEIERLDKMLNLKAYA